MPLKMHARVESLKTRFFLASHRLGGENYKFTNESYIISGRSLSNFMELVSEEIGIHKDDD